MKFIDYREIKCPYCGKDLQDITENEKEYKICNNQECYANVLGTNRWVCADFGKQYE